MSRSTTDRSQLAVYVLESYVLESDFSGAFRRRDVVAEERAVRAMCLLLDRHRELGQSLRLKPALPQHPRKLSRQRPFVVLAGEERDRLAALPSSTYMVAHATKDHSQ